jgi:hypothetical protein
MQNSVSLYTGCLLLLLVTPLRAQDFPRNDFNPERLVDEIFPAQNLDLNYEERYENLMQILANPVDLNRASAEELRSIFVLREAQVESLLAYRRDQGPFLSVYELQSIPDFDLPTLYHLMPFVKVEDTGTRLDKSLLQRMINERNSYFITRWERTLEEKKGYRQEMDSVHRYAGSPDKIYWRFRTSKAGDFSFGLTAEKDAGEAITWNAARRYYGVDYYSFHGQVLNKGRVRNLVAGDYQVQFGQGLVLGGGFGMGKGSEPVTTLRRCNLGFIPYTSLNEFGFFRGGALSYSVTKNITLHGFISSLRRDGLLHQDSLDESSLISSFAISGYHRTTGELASRKQINETNYGAILNYHHLSLDAGLILLQTDFSLPIIHSPARYNQFYFTGRQNSNLSGFLNFSKGNIAFFSEVAQTLHQGMAIAAGVLGSLTPQLDISLHYRNFSRNFHSFYSNALSDNTTPQNETGFYWGLKYVFSKKYYVSGYLDLFRFPWLRYRGYAPSDGSEWLLRFNYQPSKRILLFLQAREESKIRNLTNKTTLYQTGQGLKRNFWINCDYSTPSGWSFKTRVQCSTYTLDRQTTRGLALIQDVSFDIGRFSISARYALFDTGNYDNRLYLYERDVSLAFSFPAYDGVGIRRYALVQYKITHRADLWIRWANTQYSDRGTIGTAGETIAGNLKNDVKLQLRISL